jgi:hypothetical protein
MGQFRNPAVYYDALRAFARYAQLAVRCTQTKRMAWARRWARLARKSLKVCQHEKAKSFMINY